MPQEPTCQDSKEKPILHRTPVEQGTHDSCGLVNATMDALTSNICVLDESGIIMAVNKSWRDFAIANPPIPRNYLEGADYLAVCDTAEGSDSDMAKTFAAGIRDVTGERRETFSMEYPCSSPTKERWFIGRVGRFWLGEILRVVVAHENITERKLAEKALLESEERSRQTAVELQRKNKELEEFTLAASHDLMEPLRKIQVFGSLISSKCAMNQDGGDYLFRIVESAKRMQHLLDGLLRYARVEKEGQEFIRVKMQDVLKGVVSDLEWMIQSSGVRVEIGRLPVFDGDPNQLRQLFQNLIANAIKYRRSDRRTVVRIRGEKSGRQYRILVEDNGIGFDEKYLDKIFQPFQRLHGRNEYSGIGIGLAICRKVVERHGGRITARSTPGKGSTFIVTLPVGSAK